MLMRVRAERIAFSVDVHLGLPLDATAGLPVGADLAEMEGWLPFRELGVGDDVDPHSGNIRTVVRRDGKSLGCHEEPKVRSDVLDQAYESLDMLNVNLTAEALAVDSHSPACDLASEVAADENVDPAVHPAKTPWEGGVELDLRILAGQLLEPREDLVLVLSPIVFAAQQSTLFRGRIGPYRSETPGASESQKSAR